MEAVTLTEFLLARIAEDERAAQAALESPNVAPGPWLAGSTVPHLVDYVVYQPSAWPGRLVHACDTDLAGPHRVQVAEHIARWDPARVLAEGEAKRRIVELHRHYESAIQVERASATLADPIPNTLYAARDALAEMLRLLASVYSEHPDFDPEWRV